jgi:hypothetical protein
MRTLSVHSNGTVTERFMTGQEQIDFDNARALMVEDGRPQAITKVRLVRWLRFTGEWSRVRGRLASASLALKEDWEFANVIRRGDPLIPALGLTKAQLDTLYSEGQKL